MLSILSVILTIKVKVGIPESFKVGWYPLKKLGRVTLTESVNKTPSGMLSEKIGIVKTQPVSAYESVFVKVETSYCNESRFLMFSNCSC